jgi:hypothetical protein
MLALSRTAVEYVVLCNGRTAESRGKSKHGEEDNKSSQSLKI